MLDASLYIQALKYPLFAIYYTVSRWKGFPRDVAENSTALFQIDSSQTIHRFFVNQKFLVLGSLY